jgi:hypothetical protein
VLEEVAHDDVVLLKGNTFDPFFGFRVKLNQILEHGGAHFHHLASLLFKILRYQQVCDGAKVSFQFEKRLVVAKHRAWRYLHKQSSSFGVEVDGALDDEVKRVNLAAQWEDFLAFEVMPHVHVHD